MIAILSDFCSSEYLGAMKGVIYSICKNSKIVDLYNNIKPQNIVEASWILYQNYKYFPKKTIFLCVVDPSVGSARQCIAIKTKNYFFVGPDNGLINKAANDDKIVKVVQLPAKNVSKTFHGRDVYAPAAARLEKATPISSLGPKTALKIAFDFYLKGREGQVVRIDSFGNIITNLPSLGKKKYTIQSKNFKKKLRFYETYDSANNGEIFIIEGSSGTLEISLKNDSASKKIKLSIGEKIKII